MVEDLVGIVVGDVVECVGVGLGYVECDGGVGVDVEIFLGVDCMLVGLLD